MSNTLKVRKLRANASLPVYVSAGAAGLDLAASLDEAIELRPGERVRVPTGIAIELPAGHEGQVRPRSGLAARAGVTVLNAPGTIDEDFRGEIEVLLVHLGTERHVIENGDRIAQLVIAPVVRVQVLQADALSETARGPGGFGSSGR